MAQSDDIVKKVVDEVLEYIQKNDPDCYQQINSDSSKKEELIAKIKHVATEEIAQEEELKKNGGDVTKLNLPAERLLGIEDGLKMATYRFNIANGAAELTFPDGTHFKTIQLDSPENTSTAYYLQIASIIIEGVLLVLSVIGLKVPISKAIIKKTSTKLVEELTESSAFQKAVKKFVESWDNSSGFYDKAKALFYLLKDTYSLGILWNTIKLLCSEMSWWDWTKAAALITAQLVAAFATGGAALIAKIVLALKSAYDFGQKIANLSQLK